MALAGSFSLTRHLQLAVVANRADQETLVGIARDNDFAGLHRAAAPLRVRRRPPSAFKGAMAMEALFRRGRGGPVFRRIRWLRGEGVAANAGALSKARLAISVPSCSSLDYAGVKSTKAGAGQTARRWACRGLRTGGRPIFKYRRKPATYPVSSQSLWRDPQPREGGAERDEDSDDRLKAGLSGCNPMHGGYRTGGVSTEGVRNRSRCHHTGVTGISCPGRLCGNHHGRMAAAVVRSLAAATVTSGGGSSALRARPICPTPKPIIISVRPRQPYSAPVKAGPW